MSPLFARIERLRRFLRRRGHKHEDAEDLVQEAFLRLHIYCNEGNEVRSPDAFLARTAVNLAINAHVADRRHLYVSEPVEELRIADLSALPEQQLEAEQTLAKLHALLARQNPRTREIFLLHRVRGLSRAQIAERFQISVSAVEKHIASAAMVLGAHLYKEIRRNDP